MVKNTEYNEKLYYAGKDPYPVGSLIDLLVAKCNYHIIRPMYESLWTE